jgi:hypothetical protein
MYGYRINPNNIRRVLMSKLIKIVYIVHVTIGSVIALVGN